MRDVPRRKSEGAYSISIEFSLAWWPWNTVGGFVASHGDDDASGLMCMANTKQTQNKCEGVQGKCPIRLVYEMRQKPTRLILHKLRTDTQSIWIIWGTHAENSVNTREHTWIHDTQSEKQEDMLETLADKKPNWVSFSYRI